MPRTAFLVASSALVAVLVALQPPAAAGESGAAYFETTVATDTADDFKANGALDIVAIHVNEKYAYDPDAAAGHDVVQFRLQLRARDEIKTLQGQGAIDYTVGFTVGGKKATANATMTVECHVSPPPAGSGYVCDDPKVAAPHFSTPDGGVVLVLDAAAAGLAPGAAVTEIFAATALKAGDTKVYQDVAPGDNKDQPTGATLAPTQFGGPFTLKGRFPHLALLEASRPARFAVPGGSATFTVVFGVHEKYTGLDRVVVNFQGPPGWEASGNLGSDFIVTAGGQRIEYEITVKAPAVASEGDSGTVVMDAVMLRAGGRAVHAMATTVSGPKVELPEFGFELATPGPFKAEEPSTLRFTVTLDGGPLARYDVKVDFLLAGARVDTRTAKEVAEGAYEVGYTFPSGGAWTADVYVSELSPAPHRAFPVQVANADGGFLPGFELAAALGGALAALAWRRR